MVDVDDIELRAILATAVGEGILKTKRSYVDKSTPTTLYYFPFSKLAKKKEKPEGQVG